MWKKLNCFNIKKDMYVINECGKIMNNKGIIMKTRVSNCGYERVGLRTNNPGETKYFSVHRLVCKTFNIFQPLYKTTVNHKNGNKLDNNISNLEWSSYSENNKHAHNTGLNYSKSGELNGMNKYPSSLIVKICELLSLGYKNKEIRRKLNLTMYKDDNIRKLINDLKAKRKWKHITQNYTFD